MDEIKLVTSPNEIANSACVPCADWLARQQNGAVWFLVDCIVAEFTGTDGRSGSEADANPSGVPDGSAGLVGTGTGLFYASSEFFVATNRFVERDRASSGASGESGEVRFR
jgi:hypothetical protein